MNDLSTAQLRRLLAIQEQIDRLQKEKAMVLGNKPLNPAMTAEARRKISDAVKKRWAERKRKGLKKL